MYLGLNNMLRECPWCRVNDYLEWEYIYDSPGFHLSRIQCSRCKATQDWHIGNSDKEAIELAKEEWNNR